MESLEIEIDVNESYINRVEPRQPVEAALDAYPEWKIPAKSSPSSPRPIARSPTVKVRVGFDKLDPRILPEMGVKVAFASRLGLAPWRAPLSPSQKRRATARWAATWCLWFKMAAPNAAPSPSAAPAPTKLWSAPASPPARESLWIRRRV